MLTYAPSYSVFFSGAGADKVLGHGNEALSEEDERELDLADCRFLEV